MSAVVDQELSSEGRDYILSRGFRVLSGVPSLDASLPYVVFAEPFGPAYRQTAASSSQLFGVPDRSVISDENLARSAEKMVSDGRVHEGTLFSTSPGKPIDVYVVDEEWRGVAKLLQRRADWDLLLEE